MDEWLFAEMMQKMMASDKTKTLSRRRIYENGDIVVAHSINEHHADSVSSSTELLQHYVCVALRFLVGFFPNLRQESMMGKADFSDDFKPDVSAQIRVSV